VRASPMQPLRAVGFWAPPPLQVVRPDLGPADPYVRFLAQQRQAEIRSGNAFLPNPNDLVTFLGSIAPRQQVLAYLDTGHVFVSSLGWSTCRCCGISGSEMGDSDLTDGTWVWPEGLSHYLRMHGVPLPEEFLASMNQNQFVVPAIRGARLLDVPLPHDFRFWHGWTASVYRASRS